MFSPCGYGLHLPRTRATGDAAARHWDGTRCQLDLPVPQGALLARRIGAAAAGRLGASSRASPRGVRRERRRLRGLGARSRQVSATAFTAPGRGHLIRTNFNRASTKASASLWSVWLRSLR